MSDSKRSEGNILWWVWFVILPLCSILVMLFGGINGQRKLDTEATRVSLEVRDKNIIDIFSGDSPVAVFTIPRKSPTPVELTICRAVNSNTSQHGDFYVRFRTQEDVTFTNQSYEGRAVALVRVDVIANLKDTLPPGLSVEGENTTRMEAKAFESGKAVNLPTYIKPRGTTKDWRFVGVFTAPGGRSEMAARQIAEQFKQNLEAFVWKLSLDDGTSIKFETIPVVRMPGPIINCEP
jgi:hypothetical protein